MHSYASLAEYDFFRNRLRHPYFELVIRRIYYEIKLISKLIKIFVHILLHVYIEFKFINTFMPTVSPVLRR